MRRAQERPSRRSSGVAARAQSPDSAATGRGRAGGGPRSSVGGAVRLSVGGGAPRAQAQQAQTAPPGALATSLGAAAAAAASGSGGPRGRLSLPIPLASPAACSSRSPQPQSGASRRAPSSTREEIKRIDANREQRRKAAEEARRCRQEEAAALSEQCGGAVPDVDFHRMIRDFQAQCPRTRPLEPLDPSGSECAMVCVRKRPLQQQEANSRELDCVTARNPAAFIHERKFKVDGITKCLESHRFEFDRVFHEDVSTDDVFRVVAEPLVPWAIATGGRATLFAYGQTGSGKTYTMTGIQRLLAEQIFEQVGQQREEPMQVSLSFFEIYGGRPYDLLNNRQRLETLEDAKSEVQVAGLAEFLVGSPEAMLQHIELGNSLRTTHATSCNADSSRSHAICAVFLRSASTGAVHAKLSLVDLAGSERAADSKSSIRQRRIEGAEINKSLLALKECIRAMGDRRDGRVPFRASKLTMVLRDAFVSRGPSRTVMIACISPCMTSADHSINTLRYSDRLKDRRRDGPRPPTERGAPEGGAAGAPAAGGAPAPGGAGATPAEPSCPVPPRSARRSSAARPQEQPAAQPPAPRREQRASSAEDQLATARVAVVPRGAEKTPSVEEAAGAATSPRVGAPRTAWEDTSQPPGEEPGVAEGLTEAALSAADFQTPSGVWAAPGPVHSELAEVDSPADLAHLEAVDEVQQWEDRIISQHMVALQEDARLLTAESELLSQVQQDFAHDIDGYVDRVESIARRKMEVYAAFLGDLEAFKRQLRREEVLSWSCRRPGGAEGSPLGQGLAARRPSGASQDSQWTPRTPRVHGETSAPALLCKGALG